MEMTQEQLRAASKTSVHDTVRTLNADANKTELSSSRALTASDLARLLADPAALRDMAKGKLVEIILSAEKPTIALIPAIRELLDRVDGKPAQSVNMDATIRNITVNATVEFIRSDDTQITIENQM